jgi:hypothetical protein
MVMTFVLNIFITARRGVDLSENHVNAALTARSILDDIRRGGFAEASPGEGKVTFSGLSEGKTFSQDMKYTTSLQELDTNRKLIWVEVTWSEATGDKRVVLETIMTEP